MSPGAAPPLPSQLLVHFLYCSTNLWLIVESFVSFDPVYPCCCIACDLPTELSRSNHCLTLTSSGWDTLQNYKPLLEFPLTLWEIFSYVPTTKPIVHALQAENDVYILTPTTWNPHTNIHATNDDSMLDWEGNIKEKREWASQVVLEDVEDHIDAFFLNHLSS